LRGLETLIPAAKLLFTNTIKLGNEGASVNGFPFRFACFLQLATLPRLCDPPRASNEDFNGLKKR
jgi:hypothetical protein